MDLNVQILGTANGSRDKTPPSGVEGQTQHSTVEVVRAKGTKPFLGEYRHRSTAVEYHHATTQTMARRKAQNEVSYVCDNGFR